jgi:hypothetical protein
MPDRLYHRDILAWSQHQADLLRRLGQGQTVNDVDWTNVAEEIADAGLSELHAVETYLNLAMTHLLKIQAWPDNTALDHWPAEIVMSQRNALRRFTPSMRQRIDIDALYADALASLHAGDRRNNIPRPYPRDNPLDQLLNGDADDLIRLPQASPSP